GSLGIDLATAVDVTLVDSNPVRIPTTTRGPLHSSKRTLGALLISRSSTGMQGIMVCPGVIDAGFTRVIEVVAYTHSPPAFVSKSGRIAQLVPLNNLMAACAPSDDDRSQRGGDGFGSTGGLACLTLNMRRRPTLPVTMTYQGQQITFDALFDMGDNVTIIS
ncbi:hypothetical protein N309_02834, partial [Tinamus guttatus]